MKEDIIFASSFLNDLYYYYKKIVISESNVSTVIETQTEKEKEKEKEKQKEKQVQINTNRYSKNIDEKDVNVNLCIINENDDSNFIYFSKFKGSINYSMIIILYNYTKNNLYIIPISHINTIFQYNKISDFIENFTIISIHNNKIYGKNNDNEKYYMLKLLSKMLLEKHNNEIYLKDDEMDFIRNNKMKYDELRNTFNKYYNFDRNLLYYI